MKVDINNNLDKKNFGISFFSRYYKILALLIVAIVGGVGYYILYPKYQEVSLGGEYSIETLKSERQTRQRYLYELKKLKENYQKINQADIDKLNQILPSDRDIPGLFVQVAALAEDNGFILDSVNISQEAAGRSIKGQAKQEIKKLNISLNLRGSSYQSLKYLLNAIEYNLRIFDVDAVYFSPDSDKYSVNLFTYYLAE
jgi:Tfp pilus assembly protein PilO